MNSKVSIIVPVYKTEKYLDRCVESILNQSYENIELILVDDGSPDNCPQMCDEWASKDCRIKVLHKVNGGVSSARNLGISVATGAFVQFVDSDDYIERKFIENVMNGYRQYNVELMLTGFKVIDDRKSLNVKSFDKEAAVYWEDLNLDDFVKIWADGFITCVVNKIYKKEFITDLFMEGLPLGEDLIFNLNYLKNIRSFAFCKESGYVYEFNGMSATHKKRDGMLDILSVSMNELVLFLDKQFKSHNSQSLYQIFGDMFITCVTRSTKKCCGKLKKELKNNVYFNEYITIYKPNGFINRLKKFLLKHYMFKTINFISRIKHM